jgi:hypothetical protein
MQDHPALRVGCTRVLVQARVHALAVDAGLLNRTVIVSPAPNQRAPDQRIAFVPRQASALGHVVLRVAFCVSRARVVDQAGVDAVAVVASLVQWTVTWCLASN